jgi:hypothetical protein
MSLTKKTLNFMSLTLCMLLHVSGARAATLKTDPLAADAGAGSLAATGQGAFLASLDDLPIGFWEAWQRLGVQLAKPSPGASPGTSSEAAPQGSSPEHSEKTQADQILATVSQIRQFLETPGPAESILKPLKTKSSKGVVRTTHPVEYLLVHGIKGDLERIETAVKGNNAVYARQAFVDARQKFIEYHFFHPPLKGAPLISFFPGFAPDGQLENTDGLVGLTKVDAAVAAGNLAQGFAAGMEWLSSSEVVGSEGLADPLFVERVVRSLIRIALRTGQSQQQLNSRLVALSDKKGSLPVFLKDRFKVWKAALENLQKKNFQFSNVANVGLSAKQIMDQADGLGKMASEMQRHSMDENAFVYRYAALLAIFAYLGLVSENAQVAQGYYRFGLNLRSVNQPTLKDLNEALFPACIQLVPGTKLSQDCFSLYQEMIYVGFSGSSGTNIPVTVRQQLQELEQAIEKKAPTKSKSQSPLDALVP